MRILLSMNGLSKGFTRFVLFSGLSCICGLGYAAPFDYYLKCDIRERNVYPPSRNFESTTRLQRYVVCITEGVNNASGSISNENQTIGGPAYDGRTADDMNCAELKTKKAIYEQRRKNLLSYQTAAIAAMDSLNAGLSEANRVKAEVGSALMRAEARCENATADAEDLVTATGISLRCMSMRNPADRADCAEAARTQNPEYKRLQAIADRLCVEADTNRSRMQEVEAAVTAIAANRQALSNRLSNIRTEISKTNIQLNRLRDGLAEQSCP